MMCVCALYLYIGVFAQPSPGTNKCLGFSAPFFLKFEIFDFGHARKCTRTKRTVKSKNAQVLSGRRTHKVMK